jgi:hypothetical protein
LQCCGGDGEFRFAAAEGGGPANSYFRGGNWSGFQMNVAINSMPETLGADVSIFLGVRRIREQVDQKRRENVQKQDYND